MFRITEFDTIDSTNTYLKALAESGEDEGRIIIAKAQTAGRGRMGRTFHSPDSTGLYMSILLKPACSPEASSLLTPLAAVAAAEAIEELSGKSAGIKWVNDIFMNGRKVCGILTEASFSENKIRYAVIGAGFNIAPPRGGFPDEISGIAGAIFDTVPEEDFREKLALSFAQKLFSYYARLEERDFLEGYINRSVVLRKKVTVMKEPPFAATVKEIDRDCRLILEKDDGEIIRLGTGEISIKI